MRNDIVMTLTEAGSNGYDILSRIQETAASGATARGILLRALNLQMQKKKKKKEKIFIPLAQEEASAALADWVSYYRLNKNSKNRAEHLLSSAIHEECIADHLNNLILIAAILDASGQVKAVMRRLDHDNKHVRARAL